MTPTQRDAARAYARARADVHRLDPETLAHAAAVCAADLARERYWTALALARSATYPHPLTPCADCGALGWTLPCSECSATRTEPAA